jgi:hypothetical protein
MSIGTILLIVLIIILLGGFSGIGGGPFYGTGYYGEEGSASWSLFFLSWSCWAGFEQDHR